MVTTLGWLSREDLTTFFCRFIGEFTPEEPEAELRRQADRFIGENSPWGSTKISFDMAKQYLMLRISSFRAQELSQDKWVLEELFRVPSQRREHFFAHLCDAEAGNRHLTAYPPVQEGTTACVTRPQRPGVSAKPRAPSPC